MNILCARNGYFSAGGTLEVVLLNVLCFVALRVGCFCGGAVENTEQFVEILFLQFAS